MVVKKSVTKPDEAKKENPLLQQYFIIPMDAYDLTEGEIYLRDGEGPFNNLNEAKTAAEKLVADEGNSELAFAITKIITIAKRSSTVEYI